MKRQKTHFHDLPCGASVILGNNGFVWIYPTPEHKEEDAGGFIANLEVSKRHCHCWDGAALSRCCASVAGGDALYLPHCYSLSWFEFPSKHCVALSCSEEMKSAPGLIFLGRGGKVAG